MSGKPAARIGDSVVKGVITTGSATVLIGSQGGVACSTCPGGMAVGNPVNPSLGAKVLGGAEDLDFALPGAMGLVWQRQYSSYVNPSQGGACGLLGYGWTLPFEMSLQLNEDCTLLFDASGRTLTFPEVLPPGGYLFSNSEGLYIVRGNAGGSCEWRNESRFAGVPATWRKDSDSLMATSGDGQMLWRFVPHTSPLWSEPRWLLHAKRDRFGREQHYSYETVHHSLFDATGRERLLEYPWPLLTRISDGCGRVFHIQYIALHAEAWDLPRIAKLHEQNSFHPFQPDTSGHQGQAGWQADSGWRVQAVAVVELDGSRHSLVHYGYSTQGDLIEVRDRYQQVVRRFAYKNHLLYAHQERQGPEHVYGYEADLPGARVLEQRNEEGLNYVFLYEAHPDAPDDPERSQTRVRDSLGREDVYEFAGQGGLKRLMRHQRPDGSILAYKYNGFGYLTGQTDAAGRTTWLPRDGQGRLLGVRSSIGPHLSLNYNEHGLLVERRLGLQSTRYVYDDWQRLVQITHPDGSTEGFAYLDLSSPSSPQGNTQTSRHSLLTAEYPRCVIDTEGGERQLEWSLTGQLLSHTDCSGHTTQYQYTPLGQIKEVRYANDHSQRYHYNSLNQLERTRHADGSGEHYQYDPRGRLIGVIPLDTLGQPLDEQSIQLDYDLWSRIIRRTHAGVSLQFAYDARGLLTELINENGANSRFEWDVMDRLSKEEGVDGRIQHYHYNPLGLLICQDDGQRDQWRSIHYAYDDKGRLALRRYGQAEAFVPQPQEQDLLLPGAPYEQRFEWDDMGRLMLARHGYGHGELMQPLSECQFEYTPAGQLAGEIQRIWLTDSNGTPQIQHEYLVQHQYDLLGNRSQSLLPELGELGLLRYGSGHLHGIALNQQSLISFQRDALHREVERRYDLYPLANPETSPLDPVELIRTQHYDPLGRLQQRSYQGLPGTENGSGEHQPLVALQQRHYHYDALGQLVRIQQPASKNGWHYSYDAQGRLHSAHNDQDPASQQRWWFDAAGNPLPPPHAPQPVTQDWAETVRQRLHDPGFNLLQPEQQPDTAKAHCWPDNQVLFHDQHSYQYDTRGNRTHSHDQHTGITRQYHYDALNQLVAMDQFDDSKQLQRSVYLYDPLGRRLHKQVQHFTIEANRTLTAQGKPASEYYGWDGDRLTMYKQHDQQWHYLYEPDSFTPLLLIRQDSAEALSEGEHLLRENLALIEPSLQLMPSEQRDETRRAMREHIIMYLKTNGLWEDPKLPQEYYFYHCNHLGLPEALTDPQGQPVWSAEYDAWGNLTHENNPKQLEQRIRLPGQFHDTETGLYYNRYRYYDPQLRSYINQDPIGLSSGEPNFYAYPRDPLSYVDPLGLFAPLAWGALVAGGTAVTAIANWGRNLFNEDLEGRSPESLIDNDLWEEMNPDKSVYHTMGEKNLSCNDSNPANNRKLISPNGRSEFIFDEFGCLVTDPINTGTYNYFSPNTLYGIPHGITDVVPYYIFGTSPVDMFSTDRFKTTWGLIKK